VDAHIFVEAQRVVDALKQRDCATALTWCSQHAAKLKKIRSRLEFKLRLQACLLLLLARLLRISVGCAHTYGSGRLQGAIAHQAILTLWLKWHQPSGGAKKMSCQRHLTNSASPPQLVRQNDMVVAVEHAQCIQPVLLLRLKLLLASPPQEFVELVRRDDMAAAIGYARRHLSQWAGSFEAEHQRAFAVLVFTADTQCARYQVGGAWLVMREAGPWRMRLHDQQHMCTWLCC